MKFQNVLLLSVTVILVACGTKKTTEVIYTIPKNCTVTKSGGIATITCPDGTSTTVSDGTDGANGSNGSNGYNGSNGSNGSNGHSAAFSIGVAGSGVCPNGGSVINMGVDTNDDAVLQLSETVQTAIVCNGTNGYNGTNGSNAPPTPFTPVAIINPCGDAPGIDDEVFLQLYNGQVLWSESDNVSGTNTRFSLARAGTWQTTDNDHCVFTMDASLTITYENHHY